MKLTLHDVAQTCAWINTAAFVVPYPVCRVDPP